MSYKYLEGLTMADVAFRAEGLSIKEMFESAGLATTNVMVKDLRTVKKKVSKQITGESDSVEKLLFNFLDDIIFFKDKETLLFSDFDVDLDEKNGKYILKASASGEKIDHKRHEMLVDVKAPTWHKFSLTKKGKKWQCQVILDI